MLLCRFDTFTNEIHLTGLFYVAYYGNLYIDLNIVMVSVLSSFWVLSKEDVGIIASDFLV